MNVGISFTMCSFFFILLLTIVFFSKKRFESFENKIYSYLILTSLFGTSIGVLCYYFMKYYEVFGILNIITSKGYLVYLVMWLMLFTLYILAITLKNVNTKKIFNVTLIVTLILLVGVIFLPLYYHSENGSVYSYGPSTNLMYLISGIYLIIIVGCCIKNIKYIKEKKYVPIFAFLLVGTIVMVIQKLNPGLLLITFGEAFITFLMYFTIENPDLQMIGELYKNKELVEQTYEDKSNFLFEMTSEVRGPLVTISKLTEEIKNEKNIDIIKEHISDISMVVKQLDFTVNDVLNISSLDSNKLKVIDNRYNLQYLFDDIVSRIKPALKNDIEFRTDIPHNVPMLYGDSIKLKQVLYSILMNSVNKTKEGFIEFKVDIIEKFDVCRVIFTINDCGSGMDIDKINEILSVTGEFSADELKMLEKSEINVKLCQKVIKVLGGNLLIKSQPDMGTKTILTIDQKIFKKDDLNSIINNYENSIYKAKRVLIVSQDKVNSERIIKILKKNDISYSHILYGMDAVDKINSGKKYDYILIDDEMKEMSGYTTLKELEKINGFKIPVIIMLKKNKDNIKDHYLNDGFADYILLDDIDKELDKIINKY